MADGITYSDTYKKVYIYRHGERRVDINLSEVRKIEIEYAPSGITVRFDRAVLPQDGEEYYNNFKFKFSDLVLAFLVELILNRFKVTVTL